MTKEDLLNVIISALQDKEKADEDYNIVLADSYEAYIEAGGTISKDVIVKAAKAKVQNKVSMTILPMALVCMD